MREFHLTFKSHLDDYQHNKCFVKLGMPLINREKNSFQCINISVFLYILEDKVRISTLEKDYICVFVFKNFQMCISKLYTIRIKQYTGKIFNLKVHVFVGLLKNYIYIYMRFVLTV